MASARFVRRRDRFGMTRQWRPDNAGPENALQGRGASGARASSDTRDHRSGRPRDMYAALDLGTNNCRLLIAHPTRGGFRVVDGYSEIVRLGEGLAASGRLSEAAMARTYRALATCAERIAARPVVNVGCIATQAMRVAANGPQFLDRVRQDLGLRFRVIKPKEEAKLAVLGCAQLIDDRAQAALVVDIGGGSTELSWVDANQVRAKLAEGIYDPPLRAWGSTPVGVVTLADSHPETADVDVWYENLVRWIAVHMASAPGAAEELRPLFESGKAHIVGTSGAVTSLAALHLGLRKYRRADVDGAWITPAQCREITAQLRKMSVAERAAHPCIGPDRADLIVPGAAILDAICRLWPVERIRVADRGLREGVLMQLMAQHRGAWT